MPDPGKRRHAGRSTARQSVRERPSRWGTMTRASSRPLAAHAYAERFAIPAFNVINMEFAQAVIAAAEEAAAPVILQVSPGAGIEAELGLIGGREDTDIASARRVMTTPEEAAAFVAACPVDFLAPAIGSIHRMPDDSVILDV